MTYQVKRPIAALTAALTIAVVPSVTIPVSAYAQNINFPGTLEGSAATRRETTDADLNAYPLVREQITKGQLANALVSLQAEAAKHENDPQYYNLVGIIAMKANDYRTAASALERVVIMQPDNAGAWLDLAIADAEIGNFVSALGYFDHVEDQFDPPAPLRNIISRYRARILSQTKARAPWQFSVQAMAGVDSNANSGLQNSAIPLTLNGERIDLLLDPTYKARSDTYAQLGAGATYRRQIGSDQFEIAMGVRKRTFTNEHEFSTLDFNLGASILRSTSYGDATLALQAEHLSLGGRALLRNLHAIAQIDRPVADCRYAFSAELEWRRYISQALLDGDILWGQAGLACDWTIADVKTRAALIARFGADNPTGIRPGGKTKRSEILAQVNFPLKWGATTELSVSYATAQDADGYSGLLENNAARRLERRSARVLFTMPLTASSDVMVVAEDNRFTSNLALFQQRGKSISVGLKQRF